MQFAMQLGNLDWQRLKDVAQAAEELGFDSLMLPDHFIYEGPERQANLEFFAYESMIKAAVMVEATKKVEIGHLVLCNLFRHPMITAQGIMSLDTLSGGRTFLGIGTGWTETEFRMTGIPFPDIGTRLRMLDESLTVLRSLLGEERTTFDGEFYHFKDAVLHPKPIRKPYPPILLGGGGKGLLRLAAKHADVINIISETGKPAKISIAEIAKLTEEAYLAKIRFVREEAERLGRDPDAIAISNAIFTVAITETEEEARSVAEGMAGFFHLPPEIIGQTPLALIGTPEQCVVELRRRIAAWGLSQVTFAFTDEGSMKRLANEILPELR